MATNIIAAITIAVNAAIFLCLPNSQAEYINPDAKAYINVYVPVAEGEPDYHNPYVVDYHYGDIHHRLGENCPESYYDLCEIWKTYGEMYEAGELTHEQLEEMDYYIFSVSKGTTVFEEVEKLCWEYYEKYVK